MTRYSRDCCFADRDLDGLALPELMLAIEVERDSKERFARAARGGSPSWQRLLVKHMFIRGLDYRWEKGVDPTELRSRGNTFSTILTKFRRRASGGPAER